MLVVVVAVVVVKIVEVTQQIVHAQAAAAAAKTQLLPMHAACVQYPLVQKHLHLQRV